MPRKMFWGLVKNSKINVLGIDNLFSFVLIPNYTRKKEPFVSGAAIMPSYLLGLGKRVVWLVDSCLSFAERAVGENIVALRPYGRMALLQNARMAGYIGVTFCFIGL